MTHLDRRIARIQAILDAERAASNHPNFRGAIEEIKALMLRRQIDADIHIHTANASAQFSVRTRQDSNADP